MPVKTSVFAATVTAALKARGAQTGTFYDWYLPTVAGRLDISPYENWVACRFDDVERARVVIRFGWLNPWTGKWNWHFDRPATADDVAFFLRQLDRVLLPAEAGDMPTQVKADAET